MTTTEHTAEPRCADCGHGTLAHNAIGGACAKCECGHFRPESRCSRCHRPLRSPASIAAGKGSRCAAIDAALAGLDSRQQDKARDAIADGAVQPVKPGVAQVVSDDGDDIYLTSVHGNCSCPHGARRASATVKTCWHPGSVRLFFSPRRVLRRSDFTKAA